MFQKSIKLVGLITALMLSWLVFTSAVLAIGSDVRVGTLGSIGNVYYGAADNASDAGASLLKLETYTGTTYTQKFRVDMNGNVYIQGTQICTSDGCTSSGGVAGFWKNDGPGGSTKIYYNSDNVGIGTNNPDAKLHVSGTTNIYTKVVSTSAGSYAGFKWANDTQAWRLYTPGGIVGNAAAGSAILYNDTSGSSVFYAEPGSLADSIAIIPTSVRINDGGADLDFVVLGDTDPNLIRADAGNDRIGIGTASPSTKLDVVGNIKSSGKAAFGGYGIDSKYEVTTPGLYAGSIGIGNVGNLPEGVTYSLGVKSDKNIGVITIGSNGGIFGKGSLYGGIFQSSLVTKSSFAKIGWFDASLPGGEGGVYGQTTGGTAIYGYNTSFTTGFGGYFKGKLFADQLCLGTEGNCLQDWPTGSVPDNLGNHTASQNIKLSGNWLSNDGGNEGIKVDNNGHVTGSGEVNAQWLHADAPSGDSTISHNLTVDGYGKFNNVTTTDSLSVGGDLFGSGELFSISNANRIQLQSGLGKNMVFDAGDKYQWRDRDSSYTTRMELDSSNGNLSIGGTIKITGGTPGANKVLTSVDGTGLATWQSASGIAGSGTTNYVTKFTPNGTTLGNSSIYDNGTNVGIGTASPSEKLQVAGNIKLGASGFGGEGDLKDINSLVGYNDLYVKGGSSETAPIYYGASVHRFYTNGSEKLTILNDGSVGIGTITPSSHPLTEIPLSGTTLSVTNTAVDDIARVNIVADWPILGIVERDGTANNRIFAIHMNNGIIKMGSQTDTSQVVNSLLEFDLANGTTKLGGKVGIGTASPVSELDVKSVDDNKAEIFLHHSISGDTSTDGANFSLFGNDVYLTNRESGDIKFYNGSNGGNERMTIKNDGSVGIGTASPSRKLQVIGGILADSLEADNITSYNNITASGDITTKSIRLTGTLTSPPDCDASLRGTLWFIKGLSGVKDTLEVCAKDSGNNYNWRVIY